MISIKNRSRLVLMVVAYVVLAPLNTSAITEQQRGLFSKNDISFYAGDGCTGDFTVGITGARGVGDDMLAKKGGLSARLMEIKDPAKFAEAIDKWIEKNAPDNSPFRKIKSGQLAIAGGKRAGINPILPIIISRMESSFGVYVPHPSNAYGRTATQSQPHVTVSNNRWYTWDSLEQSLYDTKNENDMYMYIKDVYSDIIDQGIVSVMTRYAPPHENDTATYVNNLNTWAKEVYDLAGDSINKDQLGAIGDSDIDSSCSNSATSYSLDNMTIYYQADFDGTFPGCGTIAECGCGATSLAMVLSSLLKDKSITPITMVSEMAPKGFTSYVGTSWEAFTNIPTSHGLKSEDIQTDMSKARQALSEGKLIIMSQSHGIFTSGGHIVVIRGLTSDGRFLVADPNKFNKVNGNQACGSGECTTISRQSSEMTDVNGDGFISYTENSAGFSEQDVSRSLKGMWAISK